MVLAPNSFTDKPDQLFAAKHVSLISGFLSIQSFLSTGQMTCKVTPYVKAKVQALLQ